MELKIRFFDDDRFNLKNVDWKLLSKLPGYLSKKRQNQSESSPQNLRTFTPEELNQQLQRFITDYWEKESSLKTTEQGQSQRWEPSSRKQSIGLNETSDLYRLPVRTRTLFKHRLLVLNHQHYRGEDKLENYIGNLVNVRFDPNDSSVVYVFVQEGDREVFVGNAFLV
ncbi:Mu transposase C-terminal domain-containing protein [Kovacikia minuta CCNUW1]|uniref:Mu transposase C-terminal domain-containing protein n=1 Tax=Kovacikia minuta TaxID=2931930 RepID=UPI001CCFEEEF|nr:Mu transposase C-terminal domain-containing protein [Kovacikia minuta]UBF23991.1 Mu transposase C-terminal domain-containing protein [Kovacikia minuta CCNUW1]